VADADAPGGPRVARGVAVTRDEAGDAGDGVVAGAGLVADPQATTRRATPTIIIATREIKGRT
jgi:hypothetical protein